MIAIKDLRLAVAMPSYNGTRHNGMSLMALMRSAPNAVPIDARSSALTMTFNDCLTRALKLAHEGKATHFLMIHDDIVPCDLDWFERFWRAYEDSNAQILSAVSPIKDGKGLSSVALDCGPTKYLPRRMTMAEVHAEPETFTRPDILLNTGLMLFALDEPWLNGLWFRIDNDIVMAPDGNLHSRFEPEDWAWSRDARARGCERLYATRAVKLWHVGQQMFPNFEVWGQKRDEAWFENTGVAP